MHPILGIQWNGDRRVAVIGLPQSGGTTIAIHLLRGLTRLGVPAVGHDQSRNRMFGTRWRHARRAASGHGYWPEVRTVENVEDLASMANQAVVIDAGHSDAIRKKIACLATLIVLVVANRNSPDERERFRKLIGNFPTAVPKLLVGITIDNEEPPIDEYTLSAFARTLGAQNHFAIPYFEAMPSAIDRGDDVWTYSPGQSRTPDRETCRRAIEEAVVGITEKLCSGPPGWRNRIRDIAIREATLRPSRPEDDSAPRPRRPRIHQPGAEAHGPLIRRPEYAGLIPLNFDSERQITVFGEPIAGDSPAPTADQPTRGPNEIARQWKLLSRSTNLDIETLHAAIRVMDKLECNMTVAFNMAIHAASARLRRQTFASIGLPLPDVPRGATTHHFNFQIGPRHDAAWVDLAHQLPTNNANKTRALRWAIRLLDHILHNGGDLFL